MCHSPVLGKLGGHQVIQVALALDPAVQMFRPTSEAWGHGGLHGARPAVVVVAAPAAHLGHFGREKSGETSRVNLQFTLKNVVKSYKTNIIRMRILILTT